MRIITVISMFRHDAEQFVTATDGSLTDEQKDGWRKGHLCDDHSPQEDGSPVNNMGFKEIDLDADNGQTLVNAF